MKSISCASVVVVATLTITTTEAFAPSLQATLPHYQEELSSLTSSRIIELIPLGKGKPTAVTLESTASRAFSTGTIKKRRSMQRRQDSVTLSVSKKKAPRLTQEQEAEYAYRIKTFRAAVKLRDNLVRFQSSMYIHPTEAEWAEACGTTVPKLRRIIEQGQEALSTLVAANTGLVVQQAKKYHSNLKYAIEADGGVGTILTVSDMIQEGNLGLMEAAERFKPEKGFRFSTYATYWVRQRILRSISDSSRVIRLPVHVHDTLQRIRKAKVEIKRETGWEPNITELAHYLEMDEEKIRMYTSTSRNVLSLERPMNKASAKNDPESPTTLLDTLASDAPTPEEDAALESMRSDVRTVLETELAGVERDVVMCRFGLKYHAPYTVAETAEALDISRDRVRLLEARALNKLRHPRTNYKLKEYMHKDESVEHEETVPFYHGSSVSTSKPDRIWFF